MIFSFSRRQPLPPKLIRGFSLIEILLVIGLIMLLAIAGFVMFERSSTSRKVNQEITNLAAIEAGIKTVFPLLNGNYSTLPNSGLTLLFNQARIIPSNMNGGDYTTGDNITHSWGGPVTMHVTNASHGGVGIGKGISINYVDVPSEGCVGLVSKGIQRFAAIQVVYARSADVVASNYTMANIVNLCSSAETGSLRFVLN